MFVDYPLLNLDHQSVLQVVDTLAVVVSVVELVVEVEVVVVELESPMLNAAELANKLMNQAQEVRKQGVKKQNELVEEQKRTTVAIKNMGRVDQFTVIPA